ncbi:hypothetical protein [Gloeocapsopsis sp. IPPAS B-1203]|nr:hypothetical protein [Gloeocapsopsis sp. IPPAS B-1203]
MSLNAHAQYHLPCDARCKLFARKLKQTIKLFGRSRLLRDGIF